MEAHSTRANDVDGRDDSTRDTEVPASAETKSLGLGSAEYVDALANACCKYGVREVRGALVSAPHTQPNRAYQQQHWRNETHSISKATKTLADDHAAKRHGTAPNNGGRVSSGSLSHVPKEDMRGPPK